MFCRVKEQHPKLESVEYHWVDDLIAKIMIWGPHSYYPRHRSAGCRRQGSLSWTTGH